MSKWHDDKTKVKDVFDSLRNYAICGAIFYAGTYCIVKSKASVISYAYMGSGIAFISLSFYLFYVNTRLLNKLFLEWSPQSPYKAVLVLAIPAAISGLGVFLLTHNAFQIVTNDGSTVGATKLIESHAEPANDRNSSSK